ncbi:trypsin-like peptidase domain-containing protein [Actinomadura opuntiae]|uniref:trypsin-like peptidase domain-containing protein n=1 Tax=Actinomadura sp. OS1-43 TaxID=604315 RepID=UPI00255AE7F4|nr:trypsin-like peptidase domain-containing protein [Actinomadura sp. OS1-43]MDL4814141.1 trypsin-like peptidase domain-containing protein [Actinomadura sp. OS1-43]
MFPPSSPWAAMVCAGADDADTWRGTAILISDTHLLTCDHVATGDDLWVEFPLAEHNDERRIKVVHVERAPRYDLALLTLGEPARVPAAPLRHTAPDGLLDRAWSAFGFPIGEPHGNDAHGTVGGSVLGRGFVRLDAHPGSRNVLRKGFSGSGVWSPDYQAVVAVVVLEHEGDGKAITIHRAVSCFPDAGIDRIGSWSPADADGSARSAWSLLPDPNRALHWNPRARGVLIDSEPGHRFHGRRAALTRIVDWMDGASPDYRVLVITGAPGAGKSAVLGRIVTTADPALHRRLPPDDTAVRARPGSVHCAVHAKGKTALEVAAEIARAASLPLPARIGDLPPALRDGLGTRSGPFCVVIDALDEASTPVQARAIATELVLPLAQTCADVGVRMIVGTRKHDDAGDLLPLFGPAGLEVDLDDPRFFAVDDLTAYALATLELRGMERPGNPYADRPVAAALAARIAALAGRNFLVAGLVARSHGLYDQVPADPETLTFSDRVNNALHEFLRRVPPVEGVPAADILTALAFAQAPGLPVPLWCAAVRVLTGTALSERQLERFARSSAANFLVRSADDTFQLFHQSLNDTLLENRARVAGRANDHRAMAAAFQDHGASVGWDNAPEYLLRSLSVHAAAGGVLDTLLDDVDYLLHADLERLLAVGDAARNRRDRIQLLRLTPHALGAGPAERLSAFGLTECMERSLGHDFSRAARSRRAPYRAAWAVSRGRTELGAYTEHTDPVHAVCTIREPGDRTLLVSASGSIHGRDAALRIWSPATSTTQHTVTFTTERVSAICELPGPEGRSLLAISTAAGWAADSGTLRIWDPDTATTARTIALDHGFAEMCAVSRPGERPALAMIAKGRVSIWCPETGTTVRSLDHAEWATALCAWMLPDGRVRLATAEHPSGPIRNSTVRIWDPETGTEVQTLRDSQGVASVCGWTRPDGRTFLATANAREEVRIWDLATGEIVRVVTTPSWPKTITAFTGPEGDTLLAVGGNDRTVRIWSPEVTARADADPGKVAAVCALDEPGTPPLLVTADRYGAVRMWDLGTGSHMRTLADTGEWTSTPVACALPRAGAGALLATADNGHSVTVWEPAAATPIRRLGHPARIRRAWAAPWPGGRTMLITDAEDRVVRIWDPDTGTVLHSLASEPHSVLAACAVPAPGRPLIAVSCTDGSVLLWDTVERAVTRAFTDRAYVFTMCPVPLRDGRVLLATTGNDHVLRVRDPHRPDEPIVTMEHTDLVNALCTVPGPDGDPFLVTGGQNNTVQIWDLSGRKLMAIPVLREVLAIAAIPSGLAIGMDHGVLVVDLSMDA